MNKITESKRFIFFKEFDISFKGALPKSNTNLHTHQPCLGLHCRPVSIVDLRGNKYKEDRTNDIS